MSKLYEYVASHSNKLCVRDTEPSVDMFFFKVAAKNDPDKDVLVELINAHQGEFNECNPLDGKEHSYIEVGGWIGDQGIAMQFMGLGAILGLWQIAEPMTMLGLERDDPLAQQMAGMGLVSIYGK